MLLPLTVFLATVAYLPGVGSATSVGRWAALTAGAVACLWTIRKPLTGPGHWWGAALLAWVALTLLWTVSTPDTIGALIHWTVLGMLFLAATQFRDAESVLLALVAGLCISVPFALLQMRGLEPVLQTDVPAGLFLSKNAMGEVAACALVWAIARRRWLLTTAPAFLVVVSWSRGALLACGIGLLALMPDWRRRAAIVAVVLLVAAAWTWRYDPTLRSVLLRLDIWQFAAMNITLGGYGPGTFGTLVPGFGYAHNDFLQLGFELGLGALLAVPILARDLWSGTPEANALAAILGAALVSFPMGHPTGAMLVVVLAGLACGSRDRADHEQYLLGSCGSTRSSYEWEDSAGDLPEPAIRRPVVAV